MFARDVFIEDAKKVSNLFSTFKVARAFFAAQEIAEAAESGDQNKIAKALERASDLNALKELYEELCYMKDDLTPFVISERLEHDRIAREYEAGEREAQLPF